MDTRVAFSSLLLQKSISSLFATRTTDCFLFFLVSKKLRSSRTNAVNSRDSLRALYSLSYTFFQPFLDHSLASLVLLSSTLCPRTHSRPFARVHRVVVFRRVWRREPLSNILFYLVPCGMSVFQGRLQSNRIRTHYVFYITCDDNISCLEQMFSVK